MKMYERDKDLDNKRKSFLEMGTLFTMREVARNRDKFKNCDVFPVTDEIKEIFKQKEEAFMEMDPAPHAYDAFIRPVKKVHIDGEDVDVPKEYIAEPGKKSGLGELPADIVFANTIPIKHMSIMPRVYKEDHWVDFYVIHFHDDEVRNKNIFKMLSGETDEASIGWIKHTIDGTIFSQKGWAQYYCEIVLDAGKDTIALKHDIYYDTSESLRLYFEKIHNTPELWHPKHWEEIQCMFEVMSAWYTLQECILHDELRVFVKKAKVEKPSIRKPSKGKMRDKKFVQRYYIQLQQLFNEYDINKLDDVSDENKYKKKKALWHVSGHWRHYKKSGKRIFIQGYWKGSQRDSNTDNNIQKPIEISIDNFNDILK